MTRSDFTRELSASVVVFLVALPLCMGIAIASGVPPALGLASGIIGGLVVGWIAGSPLQVSGPAAGLAVLVFELVQEFGLAALGVAVLGAGVLQLIGGAIGLGRWFRAVSPAVIQGMLAGIGVLIFVSQFHVMVDDSPRANGIENLLSIPQSVYKGVFPLTDQNVHHLAAMIGLLTLISLIAWNTFRPKRLNSIPGPLVAVIVATAAAALIGLPVQYVTVPERLADGLNIPTVDAFMLLKTPKFIAEVFAMALIASAETLLCAAAVDQMHSGPKTNYDKELMAQGVGNVLCGGIGALPMTGVIVRSSANIEAGAKTRYSAILHGAWLLLFVAMFPHILQLVPRSALAAILVYIGYKLLAPESFLERWRTSRWEFCIYLGTLTAIVATDLLTGVLIGIGLSVLGLVVTVAHLEVETLEIDGAYHVSLGGTATFVRLPTLAEALERLPRNGEVHVHIGGLLHIDHACMDLLRNWQERHRGQAVIEWDVLEQRQGRLVVGPVMPQDLKTGEIATPYTPASKSGHRKAPN